MTVDQKLAAIQSIIESASKDFVNQVEKARAHRAQFERFSAAGPVTGVDRSRELLPVERPVFVRTSNAGGISRS